MNELVTQVAPYVSLTIVINFIVLVLKTYLPWYATIKRYIALAVMAIAVSVYFVLGDFALFTAIASSCLTWEAFTQAKNLVKKEN